VYFGKSGLNRRPQDLWIKKRAFAYNIKIFVKNKATFGLFSAAK
jgi:hypothetical protein